MKKLILSFFVLSLLLLNGWSAGRASVLGSAQSIITASVSVLGQSADQPVKADSTATTTEAKDKPFNWKGLIIGLLFLSFYGYAITMIVITLIQTKRIDPVSKEEFINLRKQANRSELATDEENQQALAYINEAYSSWKIVSEPGEEEMRSPVTMSQLKKTRELHTIAAKVMPTDDKVVDRFNTMGSVINRSETRSFSGSWKLIIVAIIATFITYLMTKSFDPGFWHWLKGFWWMPLGIVLYYFASLAPAFLQDKRSRWFKGKNIHNVLIGTIMGLFLATPATETWVTKWSDGSKTKSEEFNPVFFVMLFLTFMLIMLLGFLIIIFAGLNFIRNYLIYI
ncbi:MAG: hypothetical protein NTY96_13125 [Bacteroidetes bacterium]|nr:hypothetical protein [Bacteroidota bacterium]